MAKKLFVGNLPFAMTDADLNTIFSAHGTVTSANIVIDKFSKRSKGFGFVEFENEEDAAKAIKEKNYKIDSIFLNSELSKIAFGSSLTL